MDEKQNLDKLDETPIETKVVEQKADKKVKKPRKCILHSAWLPLLFFVLFSALFYFFAYDLVSLKYADITNAKIINIFSKYSLLAGLVFGFLSMLGGHIVYFVFKKTKLLKFNFIFPILALLMVIPWYFVARYLVYYENRYTDIAKALIYYIATPLLTTTKFVFWLIIIWLAVIFVKKFINKFTANRLMIFAILLISPIFLTGCVGTFNEWACSFFDNPDHCLQSAAIQNGNPDGCDKIAGKDFESAGSNPPKDKCYLQIAEKTGDLDVCKNIEGGPFSYTKEECLLNTSVEHNNPSGCVMLTGSDKADCISKVGPNIFPGGVIEIDEQIALLKEEMDKNPDDGLKKQLNELEQKRKDSLTVMNAVNKKEYESLTDPLNKKTAMDYYMGKIDKKTKDSLVALNDSLREKGETFSEKEYKAISEMLAYKNDPKNDIENMDETEMLKLRWNEKMGNAVDYLKFWNSNPTEKEKKLDQSLLIYQRMLERQVAINKGYSQQQQDFNREADRIKNYIKDEAYNTAVDKAKEYAFGELMDLVDSPASAPVTAVLGEAIDTVKKEAQSAEFRGLVNAYNQGMAEELSKTGGDVDKAHLAVIANLQSNPYTYEDKNTYAKYGNILENKDCDGTNPHCVNKDVFWKAMKKSYKYQTK